MKKYIYGSLLALASVVMFTACSADEGTEPGNDSNAHVTLYSYTAELPYDADCDALVRVAANSATTEAYALTELASEKEARVATLGEKGMLTMSWRMERNLMASAVYQPRMSCSKTCRMVRMRLPLSQ